MPKLITTQTRIAALGKPRVIPPAMQQGQLLSEDIGRLVQKKIKPFGTKD